MIGYILMCRFLLFSYRMDWLHFDIRLLFCLCLYGWYTGWLLDDDTGQTTGSTTRLC